MSAGSHRPIPASCPNPNPAAVPVTPMSVVAIVAQRLLGRAEADRGSLALVLLAGETRIHFGQIAQMTLRSRHGGTLSGDVIFRLRSIWAVPVTGAGPGASAPCGLGCAQE